MSVAVQRLVASMSIEQKVGQLFVLAFSGQDLAYADELISEWHVGGFYLTDDNADTPAQANELTRHLQYQARLRTCDAPLILGVDQEGAWGILTQFLDLGPGNLALGKSEQTNLTYDMYDCFSRQIQSLGYNCLLAPCADVNLNPQNPIIGQRSFGEHPASVGQHVAAAVRGVESRGCLSCVKHFPGHGDTAQDSHQTLPVIDKPMDRLLDSDLIPFRSAIAEGVSMIMTSHIRYPQLDPDFPATLSRTILTELLKTKLGYAGLIITDSMNMWAMRREYGAVEAAVQALKAGAHLIMLSEEHYENQITDYKLLQKETIQGVIDAVKKGSLDETLIDRRLAEVLTVRYQQLQHFQEEAVVRDTDAELAQQAARNAIRVLSDHAKQLPLAYQVYAISLANPVHYKKLKNSRGIGPNDRRAAAHEFLQELENWRQVQRLGFAELQQQLAEKAPLWEDKPLLVILEDYPLPGENFDNEQIDRLGKLLSLYDGKIILVLLGPDYCLNNLPSVDTVVCSYSSRAVAAREIATYLIQ